MKAGFRVARVEQTETPDGLKERKKKTAGKKPQVVAREVSAFVLIYLITNICNVSQCTLLLNSTLLRTFFHFP